MALGCDTALLRAAGWSVGEKKRLRVEMEPQTQGYTNQHCCVNRGVTSSAKIVPFQPARRGLKLAPICSHTVRTTIAFTANSRKLCPPLHDVHRCVYIFIGDYLRSLEGGGRVNIAPFHTGRRESEEEKGVKENKKWDFSSMENTILCSLITTLKILVYTYFT